MPKSGVGNLPSPTMTMSNLLSTMDNNMSMARLAMAAAAHRLAAAEGPQELLSVCTGKTLGV